MKHEERLVGVHEKLVQLVYEMDKIANIVVLDGYRDAERQNAYYEAGKTKVRYPHSKHNKIPSEAVDIAVYPINWNELRSWYVLYGIALTIAHRIGIKIRWGGDWDSDLSFRDQKFNDLVHFEIILDR